MFRWREAPAYFMKWRRMTSGVAMPCGMHSNGRPIGVQLIGENFSEARLLGIAHAWQSVTDWHLRHPAGY